jgi:hypothetical protein
MMSSAGKRPPTKTDIRVRRSRTAKPREGHGSTRRHPATNAMTMPTAILAMILVLLNAVASAAAGGGQEAAPPVSSQGAEVLDNGLVRLIFNRETGEFEAYGLHGEIMRLFQAGPAWEINERKIAAREAVKVVTRQESFKDEIGQGEKLVVDYQFSSDTPTVRYELSLYRGKPWISAKAYLPKGDYRLGDFSLVQGKVQLQEAFRTRIYVNSGNSSYSNSGVWQLGMRLWSSSALSVYYEPRIEEALSLAFYSFHRASTSVISQYFSSNVIGVNANAHYNGYRPREGELKTETLLISLARDPLQLLEDWADTVVKVVQPKFNHDTRTGATNLWYAYGNKTTETQMIKQAKLLRDSILPSYGITIADTGEWQLQHDGPDLGSGNALGSGEDQEDKRLFPHGFKWASDQVHALGLQTNFGANYVYAASESSIAKKKEPWIVWDDRSHLDYGFPIDFTHPGAQKWLHDLVLRTGDYQAILWDTDVDGGPTRGRLYDQNKIMGFEDIREGLKVTRSALEPNVYIEKACCGPYFTYLNLADRVRTGDDIFGVVGDWQHLQTVARQLAANYMLHQRFWLNDPDAIFVGGASFFGGVKKEHNPDGPSVPLEPAILDEVRMRLQYHVSAGSFPTLGENMEDLDAERMRLLTLVLPSYGQAARPLDLFLHTTPEIYDLKVKTDWEQWHVLMLQNWGEWDKTYPIRFSELGLDKEKSYLVFSFWDQAFLGEFRGGVDLMVRMRQGETYVIREVPTHPWVLATDMHLTQGGVELKGVRYEDSAVRLEGEASRHARAKGQVVIYVPQGYKIQSASGVYRVEEESSGVQVAHLQLEFERETSPWWLRFEHVK